MSNLTTEVSAPSTVRRRLLRWAAGIMILLSVGHIIVIPLLTGSARIVGWFESGLWAAVPLLGSLSSTEAAGSALTYWSSLGGFAIPLLLLGVYAWQLAARGGRLPEWMGWALAAWCLLAGIILVPSPFFAGTVAGALIIVAARLGRAGKTR